MNESQRWHPGQPSCCGANPAHHIFGYAPPAGRPWTICVGSLAAPPTTRAVRSRRFLHCQEAAGTHRAGSQHPPSLLPPFTFTTPTTQFRLGSPKKERCPSSFPPSLNHLPTEAFFSLLASLHSPANRHRAAPPGHGVQHPDACPDLLPSRIIDIQVVVARAGEAKRPRPRE